MLLMQDSGLTSVQELCTTWARGLIEESQEFGTSMNVIQIAKAHISILRKELMPM
jgi:hypothetical protein